MIQPHDLTLALADGLAMSGSVTTGGWPEGPDHNALTVCADAEVLMLQIPVAAVQLNAMVIITAQQVLNGWYVVLHRYKMYTFD